VAERTLWASLDVEASLWSRAFRTALVLKAHSYRNLRKP